MMIYMYFIWVAFGLLTEERREREQEREREQRNCRHGGKAKVDEEVWGRIGEAAFGLLSSVFSLRNAFIDRFRSARVVRKIN